MQNPTFIYMAVVLAICSVLTGCATSRPVLYPNTHLNSVGRDQAQRDIDACIALARASGVHADQSREIARDTVTGAAIGTAAGAAAGAVSGHAGSGTVTGAAGGAAGGAARGILRGGDPDPLLRRFVDRCLRDRGYDPIGWQ